MLEEEKIIENPTNEEEESIEREPDENKESIPLQKEEPDENKESIPLQKEEPVIDAMLSDIDEDEIEIALSEGVTEAGDTEEEVKVISIKELTEKTIKRNTIEAALLAAQRPIGVEEISIKLEMKKAEIEKLIQELAEDYMDRPTAIEIVQIGEGYSMQIKPEYTEKITKFASGGLIPKAVMRTLTIIAVKQPMLKSLLVKMRGSTSYDHCKFLIDRGFVTSYKKGRSSVLETTDQFADTFGLSRNVETLKNQLIEQLDIYTEEEGDLDESGTNPKEEVNTEQKPPEDTP